MFFLPPFFTRKPKPAKPMSPLAPKPDLVLVIVDAAKGIVPAFSMPEDVTAVDVRGNGALVLLRGTTIVRAYAAGGWQQVILENKQSMQEKAIAAQEAQGQAMADQLNAQEGRVATPPVASDPGQCVQGGEGEIVDFAKKAD